VRTRGGCTDSALTHRSVGHWRLELGDEEREESASLLDTVVSSQLQPCDDVVNDDIYRLVSVEVLLDSVEFVSWDHTSET
jgi:hypothetical protein